MKAKKTVLELGSYSSGTMREEDLIPTFLFACRGLRMSKADRATVRDIAKRADADDYYESEDASEDCQALFDVLNSYTPDYCYFGAHPGDGADYGVWVVEDLLTDTHQGSYDGYCYRSEDAPDTGSDPALAKQYTHWLQINERGNCTLYRRIGKRNQWREVWSIV